MRIILFFLFLFILAPTNAQAEASLKSDPEVAALYQSCAELLATDNNPAGHNHCFQLILAIDATYGLSRSKSMHSRTTASRCDWRKHEPLRDPMKMPPLFGHMPHFDIMARRFIDFIDSGAPAPMLSPLTSRADAAFAQMIINMYTQPDATSDKNEKPKERSEKVSSARTLDLLRSCKDYDQSGDGDLCRASLGGALIAYTVARNYHMPEYLENDICHSERNQALKFFAEEDSICFPADVDAKEFGARKIAKFWKPEYENPTLDQRGGYAGSSIAIIAQSIYRCSK